LSWFNIHAPFNQFYPNGGQRVDKEAFERTKNSECRAECSKIKIEGRFGYFISCPKPIQSSPRMCKQGVCLCSFPSVRSLPEHDDMVQRYINSLTQPSINHIKLYDALLTKSYPNAYKGLSFDFRNRYDYCLCILVAVDEDGDKCLRAKILEGDGSPCDSSWKVFKRGLDEQLAPTICCGICYEEWTTGDVNAPSFWGCHSCGKTACSTCAENMGDNCPYCRASTL
jgi:hypothetical protein